MSLLITMLPIYLFGNLHCLGMCGPLVMMIGRHRYRCFYFFGRTLSFALAGMIAGAMGAVVHSFFKQYYIGETASFLFGGALILLGISVIAGWQYPGHQMIARRLAHLNQALALLMLKDRAWPTCLFGFFTIALPCGQTLIVFSACALSGDASVGLLNGTAFALLTSPSLFLAMQAHGLLQKARRYYHAVIGISAIIVGGVSILRGLAEMDIISHWTFNFGSVYFHLVIF